MISKQIQEHKKLQEKYLEVATKQEYNERCQDHKQCLIIMRDYLDEILDRISHIMEYVGFPQHSENELLWVLKNNLLLAEHTQLKKDIEELNKMIGKY